MRKRGVVWVILGVVASGCGDDGTNAGGGSGTLLVDADVSYDEGGAAARISVRRAGQAVTDARVRIDSELGEVTLAHAGDGVYRGTQAGWRGAYGLRVEAGANGADHLDGAIATPERAVLTRPTVAFDPHLADHGLVVLSWSGARAMKIRVKTKEYDPGYVADEGGISISNTYFVEDRQEIELRRENSVTLRGGAPGSELSAHIETKTDITVLNPY